MNLDKTIKNWKWWVTLPLVLPLIIVVSIPAVIIFLLEMLIIFIEKINFINKPNPLGKKLLHWVQK
jgi:hypothetical protein